MIEAGKALLDHGIRPLTQPCRGGHRATAPSATSTGFWDTSRDGDSPNSLGRIPCESHTSPWPCCSRDWLCLDAPPALPSAPSAPRTAATSTGGPGRDPVWFIGISPAGISQLSLPGSGKMGCETGIAGEEGFWESRPKFLRGRG